MLPPLEYSMSVWWFATPLWESEVAELDVAAPFVVDALAPLIEQAALPDHRPPAEVGAVLAVGDISDLAAPFASPAFAPLMAPIAASAAVMSSGAPTFPAPSPAHAPTRMVLKGYAWSARPSWVAQLGPLWEGMVDIRRRDSARHGEQRQLGSDPALRGASSLVRP